MESRHDEQGCEKKTLGRIMSLGCAIIVLNGEHTIEQVLKSVSFCDEIVVVDSGSSDKTVEIAKKYTNKVYFHKWLGYGRQKNFAISKLDTDWVLSVDADEIVTKKLAEEIKQTLVDTNKSAFLLNIQLVFMGKKLRFGGTYPDYHLRLFQKDDFRFEEADVHEGVKVANNAGRLKYSILHYSYESIEDYLVKFNRYTSLIADSHHERGKTVSRIFPFLRMLFEVFKRFVVKGAFLDGYEGSVYALLSSFYVFVKYAKLIEKNNRK